MTVGFVNYKLRRRGETLPAHGPLGLEPEIRDLIQPPPLPSP